MVKRFLVILAVSAFVLSGCGNEQSRKAEEAYQKAVETRRGLDSPEEKLAVTKKFLDEFPESDHTAGMLSAAVYYQAEQLGDTTGAVAYAETIRNQVDDPEIERAVDKEMVYLYGEFGMLPKMLAVAERLSAAGALGFDDHWNIIGSAVKTENWALAREYCAKARGLADAESYRADNPDSKLTNEEVQQAVRNREGMLLVKDAWARANQGEIDAALADFAKADGLVERSYIDTPAHGLDVYWGEVLLLKGDYQSAETKLATAGLVTRNEDALAGLKKAYVGMRGSDSGFDVYAAELHRSVAKTVDDFELSDYEGERHRLSKLRNDVTLLAFWFPT